MSGKRNSQIFKNKLKTSGMKKRAVDLVMLAYRLAKNGHRNQRRTNGVRAFEHPKRVALGLMDELQIYDPEMLIAALLHDIKEDSWILTFGDIKMIFGNWVCQAVKTLSKSKRKDGSIYYDRIKSANLRIQIIKLMDRLDNVSDMYGFDEDRKGKYLRETRQIYLPLAEKINPYLHGRLKEVCDEQIV